ncbi:MAG: phosphoribosylamine--glycine ligase, partial [Chitinophagales bacterium]|nr:phosphoribosylamine--glycine ligase [Chitinophagales bacterium]
NILLLGSGGREHALAYKISQSPHCTKLFIAPGNPGTEKHGENVPIVISDFNAIEKFVLHNSIDMIVVGPEELLVKGIYDFFENSDQVPSISIIGPSAAGAMLEGSKQFAKDFMKRYSIPSASFAFFTLETIDEAHSYLEKHTVPVVLKANGLTAGKGVVICETVEAAHLELEEMLKGKFGSASTKVVIEEYLKGIEMSVFVVTDGYDYRLLPTAKDYKRIGEGDTGANTGGMGAISPVPFADETLMKKIEQQIIQPTIAGLQKEQITYKGFLYFGLMIVNQEPYLIEYNCRMGDPETEVVIPRLQNDIVDLFLGIANGGLLNKELRVLPYSAATVVLASGGYPGEFEKGKVVKNLTKTSECLVFHAGTRKRINGDIESNGGRVLAITAFGRKLSDALKIANRNAEMISFEGKYFRKDIGRDVM